MVDLDFCDSASSQVNKYTRMYMKVKLPVSQKASHFIRDLTDYNSFQHYYYLYNFLKIIVVITVHNYH